MTAPTATPIGFSPETVMTREQVASALGVCEKTVERSSIPVTYSLGERSPRYIWTDVVEWLRKGIAI